MKNGLFLLSIGCLLILLSVDGQTQSYDSFRLVMGIALGVMGFFIILKRKKLDATKSKRIR